MDHELVTEATSLAMARILEHADLVGLANTEEFAVRSFFMAAACELLDKPRFQTEWRRFDLLVQAVDTSSLIEFKYYISGPTYRLDGSPGRRKGGASAQNEREFHACVEKLRTTAIDGIDQRRLVLVYHRDDRATGPSSRSLHGSYGRLGPSASVARVWSFAHESLEARVLEPETGMNCAQREDFDRGGAGLARLLTPAPRIVRFTTLNSEPPAREPDPPACRP